MSHLDPDQVVINRHELARLHEAERQLKELRGRLDEQERRVIDSLNYIRSQAVLETKDGLMAGHRLPKGQPLQAPVRLPVKVSMPVPGHYADATASDAVEVRTYHFSGFIGDSSRTPLYVEK